MAFLGRLNKPATPGYTYRSPQQTNAEDLTPNLREDVVASQKADVDRIKRSMDTAETRPQNRKQVQEMGGRGISRTLGRAGALSTALAGGYDLGRAIDEKTGIGKKIVDKVMGPAKAEGDRVELSEDSKRRIARGDLEAKPKAAPKAARKDAYPDSDIREKVERDDDEARTADFKHGGKAKKFASGGSVSASTRGDGCAQRGKTRGMMR